LVVLVHRSVALGPPPPLFAFLSLNFANFPRIRGFLGANFRPKSCRLSPSGTTARDSGTTALTKSGSIFLKFYLLSSVRFGISPLLFGSFAGVYSPSTTSSSFRNAKRRRRQGLDTFPVIVIRCEPFFLLRILTYRTSSFILRALHLCCSE
jgi:hypothetical protein